jgi:hypothetical protein
MLRTISLHLRKDMKNHNLLLGHIASPAGICLSSVLRAFKPEANPGSSQWFLRTMENEGWCAPTCWGKLSERVFNPRFLSISSFFSLSLTPQCEDGDKFTLLFSYQLFVKDFLQFQQLLVKSTNDTPNAHTVLLYEL